MTYTERDNGASVALAPGDAFEVRLAETPTTGYHWYLAAWDRAILTVRRDEFHPPATLRPGAGGEHVREFVARAPGTLSLHLAYRRRWRSGAPAKTFSLDISVTSTPPGR
jgi:inhibitor of cysteine peptidase